jgi:hypothetical protein
MTVSDHLTRIKTTADLQRLFNPNLRPQPPALLLSASVPYWRKEVAEASAEEKAKQYNINLKYMQTSQPERIRLAVKELTESALMRGMRLVFGAHPAISPMVLEAARKLNVAPDSILIFQSVIFEQVLPQSTLDLADWSKGHLFLTPERGAGTPERRKQSLTEMRTLMTKATGLCGAVFIGGMEGTEEEASIFETENGQLPRYAIASTGSAALEMFTREPQGFSGNLKQQDWKALSDYPTSYKLTARRILDDMGIQPRSKT